MTLSLVLLKRLVLIAIFLLVMAVSLVFIFFQPPPSLPSGTQAQGTRTDSIQTVARTPVPALKGAEGTITPDVVTTLIDQVQASVTGVNTGQCGTEMTWVLQTTNRGKASFVVNLDKASLRMVDSNGKSYPLSPACGGQPYSGSFASPVTLAPGDIHKGYVAFEAISIPQGASHFDLYLVLSGAPVAFRYMLP
jgi:hypothetical protein